ncbi:MAG: hypothetical protein GEV00_17315 [Actinophytocola sp.]|nr:hypothetical protein [Actinophytocola sp.]
MSVGQEELNYRERATLRAVALGQAEITCSSEPDLFIDGLSCCDQSTVHRLARLGWIESTVSGKPGERVAAQITPLGRAVLGTAGVPGRAA